jgi:predicted DNA-binding protein with PD1-like motif
MIVSTSSARYLLLRLTQPLRLPDAMLAALRDEVVLAGWMRASGMLSDVQIRVASSNGPSSPPRRITGTVQVISMEGSIGLANGDVSCGLRVVLARETESGLETIAGDLVDARIEALEIMITAFDDVTATRQLDPSGAWVLDATAGATRPSPSPAAASPAPAPRAQGFAEVSRAPVEVPRVAAPVEAPRAAAPASVPPAATNAAPRPSPTFSMGSANAIPQRIARPVAAETEDDPVPEPGDVVEHFAFGRCEVVKTDGDRLHVRLGKDQRIKEIALEMLKVTPLPEEEGQTARIWKLARKL